MNNTIEVATTASLGLKEEEDLIDLLTNPTTLSGDTSQSATMPTTAYITGKDSTVPTTMKQCQLPLQQLHQPSGEKSEAIAQPSITTTTSSTSSAFDAPTTITLIIGDSYFQVDHSTLSESGYLTYLLSSTNCPGTITVLNADSQAFIHVLRYMRTRAYPLFWTLQNGFDYGLYGAVLDSARFFGVNRLVAWIETQRYLQAIKIEYTVETQKSENRIGEVVAGNVKKTFIPHAEKVPVYICPRNIHVHRGKPEMCGKACFKAQEGKDLIYEEDLLVRTATVITETMTFEHTVLKE